MRIQTQNRLLLGPGPSNVSPDVLKVMATPLVGHLDPYFLEVMSDLQNMLKQVFQTENELTLAMSGTGSAGMETVFVNLIEPGDKVLIGICGVFGERMKDVAQRCGAEVITVYGEWGSPIEPDQIEEVLILLSLFEESCSLKDEENIAIYDDICLAFCKKCDYKYQIDVLKRFILKKKIN